MAKVWAQVRYRAKALLAAAGLAAVGIVEYVITDPGTSKAIQASVPAPYDQLLVIALAGLAVALVHRVPVGPDPHLVGSSGAVAEPLPPTPQPAPEAEQVAMPATRLPAPAAEPAATSLITLQPFPVRVTGGN